MYQSIYYDYSEKKYYVRDDVNGWVDFQYQPTFYRRVPEYVEGALPVLTGGFATPTKKYDYNDPDLLEKDISKELVVLRELYYEFDDTIPKFHNIVYLDIETEIGGALTPDYIREAPMPITSIAIIDVNSKQKICFIVDKNSDLIKSNNQGKVIIPCKNEKDMILKFLDKWEELDPTIVATWNGEFFDMPWIYFRFRQVVGEEQTIRLSPIGKIRVSEHKDIKSDQLISSVLIGGVNHLDYMLLHKKYIMKEEPSYKLKDIGPKYANLEKIEYEGNLNQLFKNDINLFIDYNLRDVEILEGLEKKLKFLELTVLISHICNIPYEQIYYNTAMNEGAILKFLRRLKIVSPNKPTTHNSSLKISKESYAGGFILEPIPGLYFDVIDLDFTSLYPSIIKSLNLGIETLIGRILTPNNYVQDNSLEKLKERNPKELIQIQRLNKENYTLQTTEVSIGDLIEIIEENDYTISASGAFFDTEKNSVVCTILKGWFNKREHYRELKKKAGKSQNWADYKLYDNFQMAFKILQNAMYGTFAVSGWRYTDGHKICSAAITNSGQRLTKESIDFTNSIIRKETKKHDKNYICISDTDSMYIELSDLIKCRYGGFDSKEAKNKAILELADEIQLSTNLNLNNLCYNIFNMPADKHFFQLKQEVIAQSILVTGKRRYAMYITNKEGVDVEELDMKGIEMMKSNMNKKFKVFGENMIKDILFGKTKAEIDKNIISFYKSLRTTDPRELGKPTGVKQISSYVKRTAKSTEIFSEFLTGAPANTKAAVRYNDLLRFKKLDKKYESIIEGDKIYIVNLQKNGYHIETIGLPNGKVPPEIEKFVKDYIDVDGIFDSILKNKLENTYNHIGWSFPSLNSNVHKFFSF